MKLGWLVDQSEYTGGAELTAQAFRDCAPKDVEIIDCPPGEIAEADAYVVHNCTHYGPDTIAAIEGKPVVKYVHDVWPNGSNQLRSWLLENASLIFCSPMHREKFPHELSANFATVPPICRLEKVEAEPTKECVWLGHGMYVGKGIGNAVSWANAQQVQTDFIGEGPLMPHDEGFVKTLPPVSYEDVPATLAQYKNFLFLPTKIEPFGRSVVEAWAAGLNLIVNGLIGATWWIENDPKALEKAGELFWQEVENACL